MAGTCWNQARCRNTPAPSSRQEHAGDQAHMHQEHPFLSVYLPACAPCTLPPCSPPCLPASLSTRQLGELGCPRQAAGIRWDQARSRNKPGPSSWQEHAGTKLVAGTRWHQARGRNTPVPSSCRNTLGPSS